MSMLGNGAEAACTRGRTSWCTNPTKRGLDAVPIAARDDRKPFPMNTLPPVLILAPDAEGTQ